MRDLPAASTRSRLVTMGETMALLSSHTYGPLRYTGDLRLTVAGAETNVALGVRRLGHPATWIGRLGADEFGDLVEATLRGEGLNLICERDFTRPTGLMIKSRRTSTTTRVTYYRAGSAASALGPERLPWEAIASASVLHLTGITPALSTSCREAAEAAILCARRHGTLVSFDVNHRSALWADDDARPILRSLAAQADIIFAGHDEAALLTNLEESESPTRLAEGLAELGPREVVIKRGSAGAMSLVNGEFHDAPALTVAAIDPVGAGDAFVAGYLSAVLDGAGSEDRLRVANTTGAFAVTVQGDWEGAPKRDELGLMLYPDGTVVR